MLLTRISWRPPKTSDGRTLAAGTGPPSTSSSTAALARKYAYGDESDGLVTEMWTIRSTPAAAAARKRRADAAIAHSNVHPPRGT